MQLQVQGQWTQWVNYVQNHFSWKSLLAFPVNLVAFCLASTFDILLSSNNIRQWKILTDAVWTVCRKDVCTTTHILGTCKVALIWKRRDANPNFRPKSLISMFKWNFNLKIYISVWKSQFQSSSLKFSIKIATSILKFGFQYWNCNFSLEI